MTLVALPLLAIALQGPTYKEAWTFEQAARSSAGDKIFDATSTKARVIEGLHDLDAVLAYTRRPEIEALEVDGHVQAFVLQRNDVYNDMAAGYARLKDVADVLRCVQELRRNLDRGTPETVALAHGLGATYAKGIKANGFVRPLLPNAGIEAELRALRFLDPGLRFESYPYDTSDKANLTESDRVAGLSYLWSEAKYNFANFDLTRELDWNEAYAAFLPRVKKAKDRYAYYNDLREFMALLRDGHTDVALPPTLRLQKEVGAGIRTALVEGKVVVVGVAPTVLAQGVTKGDVVETIEGAPAVAYGNDRWRRRVSSSTPQDRDVRVYTYMFWRGPEGSTVRVGLRKADGALKNLFLKRSAKLAFSARPPYEFRILADGTAYFAFNTCENDVPIEGFEKSLEAIRGAGRLVIDVRENGGGNSGVGYAILSHLIDAEVKTTTWETPQYRAAFRAWRRGQEPYQGESDTIAPAKERFGGSVVVLTGPRTFSAAEDFAVACKTSKRVTLLGEATGGSTGQPLSLELPGGGFARICAKRDRYPDGTEFVGRGVVPDVEVSSTLAAVRRGGDVQLEKALGIIQGKR